MVCNGRSTRVDCPLGGGNTIEITQHLSYLPILPNQNPGKGPGTVLNCHSVDTDSVESGELAAVLTEAVSVSVFPGHISA